ncbi:MAG: bifunctional diaminohydroxyphosphoribosylaminopyrimidine deaminase/5-amino-6-(5-phosphoribosylamino)uracil reductase RibD [Prevotella sp.]|nr:bifunctional diaminohydroxyphosphoribosylaminopyrimidine deaminase/5-amino-6-(5-phosphoribosylamino)uracil reductase RibD [Prevotella sp.]
MSTDEKYMRRCLELAANGLPTTRPNPMVGAVIVARDRIIGEGYHIRCGEAHAEVNAFASVSDADNHLLGEATIYVSLEPCSHYGKTPPCADLIIEKGVRRVVVGCVDTFSEVSGRGISRLRDAGIEVEVGVLEKECRWMNRRFFTFNERKRPYIILKWAQSSNGFIDNNFHPTAISTPFTQMLAHKLRSEEDAILVGRVTAERDKPRLDVRMWSGQSPRRVVLSHATSIDATLHMLAEEGVQSLIVEGGAQTHQSFLDRRLWDELRVETAPMEFDSGTRAVKVPDDAVLISREKFGANTIERYKSPDSVA